jgi:hypothetical protein
MERWGGESIFKEFTQVTKKDNFPVMPLRNTVHHTNEINFVQSIKSTMCESEKLLLQNNQKSICSLLCTSMVNAYLCDISILK